MKTIAALIAGLLLSLTTFVAGLAIALTFLNAGEPEHRLDAQNTTALWTTEPVAVDRKSQSFERLPKRIAQKEANGANLNIAGMGAKAIRTSMPAKHATTDTTPIDTVTTGAIDDKTPADTPVVSPWRSTAHAEWCSRRYRSYDAANNTYRPYGGGRRACESPYSRVTTANTTDDVSKTSGAVTAVETEEKQAATEAADPVDEVSYEDASNAYIDGDHVQSCFDRYRSYRPEDNTYQPFDGGPRRQCR